MTRKYIRKSPKLSEAIRKAIDDVKGGMSMQNAAKKHRISRQILGYHFRKQTAQTEPIVDKRVSK